MRPHRAIGPADARLARLRSAASAGLFVEAPLIALAFVVWFSLWGDPRALGDLMIFRDAGQAVLDGQSPYPPPDPQIVDNDKFLYPAAAAIAFVPLALLPVLLMKILWLAAAIAAILIALRFLGVRDLRCYGVVFLSAPTIFALTVGALGPFLLLGVALAWRFRDNRRAHTTAIAIACVTMSKLFLWPLLLWLVATRRYRAAGLATATAVGVTLLSWAAMDFRGLREYPALVETLTEVMTWKAYSAAALATSFGASEAMRLVLTLVLVLVGGYSISRFARAGDDQRAFIAAIATALLATPVLWLHYLILLYAPIAIRRPQFSPIWLAPLVLWGSPSFESLGVDWRIALVLAATILILGRSVYGPTRAREPALAAATT